MVRQLIQFQNSVLIGRERTSVDEILEGLWLPADEVIPWLNDDDLQEQLMAFR